jgi:hypothetical protein
MPAGEQDDPPDIGSTSREEPEAHHVKRHKANNGLVNHDAGLHDDQGDADRAHGPSTTDDNNSLNEDIFHTDSALSSQRPPRSQDSDPPAQRRQDEHDEGTQGGPPGRLGALLHAPSSRPADGEEHTFDCQRVGCGGKLTIGDSACRFGHGMVVRCSHSTNPLASNRDIMRDGMALHRFKWCNRLYSFIPAEEWQHHLAWCRGNMSEPPALPCKSFPAELSAANCRPSHSSADTMESGQGSAMQSDPSHCNGSAGTSEEQSAQGEKGQHKQDIAEESASQNSHSKVSEHDAADREQQQSSISAEQRPAKSDAREHDASENQVKPAEEAACTTNGDPVPGGGPDAGE